MALTVDVEEQTPVKSNEQAPTMLAKTVMWCTRNYRLILAEFLSTMLLVFLGCSACLPISGFEVLPPMYGAFTFGLAVMLNIQVFGHISGAHMNPAVSVGAFVWGCLSFTLLLAYVAAQAAGAILGYYLMMLVSPIDAASEGICLTLPRADMTAWQAYGMESVLTSGLVFICCAFWDPVHKDKMDSLPIKIGLTVAGLSLAGGPLTGASLNPTRSLAPVIFSGQWEAHWLYWAGPITGGIVAPLLYKYIWLAKEEPATEESEPLKSS